MQRMTIKIEVDSHGYVYYAEDAGRPEYAGRLRYPDVDCGEMGNVLAMPRTGAATYFAHERQALAWMLAHHVGCDVALRDADADGLAFARHFAGEQGIKAPETVAELRQCLGTL